MAAYSVLGATVVLRTAEEQWAVGQDTRERVVLVSTCFRTALTSSWKLCAGITRAEDGALDSRTWRSLAVIYQLFEIQQKYSQRKSPVGSAQSDFVVLRRLGHLGSSCPVLRLGRACLASSCGDHAASPIWEIHSWQELPLAEGH